MEIHFPVFTKPIMCRECGQYTTTPVWVIKDVGRSTMQYAFCDEMCSHAFYLHHLNGDK